MCPNQDTHPNWVCTLICGTYAFGDPIQTIGEQAPQLFEPYTLCHRVKFCTQAILKPHEGCCVLGVATLAACLQ
jgi:hypothetical protein